MNEISLTQLRTNTHGRFTWLAFVPPVTQGWLASAKGIERSRLSKLCVLLRGSRVQKVQLLLGIEEETLKATWARRDGCRGHLTFYFRRIPLLHNSYRHQSFECWDPCSHLKENQSDEPGR